MTCWLFIWPTPTLYWCITLKIKKNNKGSKNCPNDWLFYFIYWAVNYDCNHMILQLIDSQHVLVYQVNFSELLIMSILHIIPIFPKCTNIGAVFWPTVCLRDTTLMSSLLDSICQRILRIYTIVWNDQTQYIIGFDRSYWSTLCQSDWLTNVCGTQYAVQFGFCHTTPKPFHYNIHSDTICSDCIPFAVQFTYRLLTPLPNL